MTISPLAGKPAPKEMLIDPARLAYPGDLLHVPELLTARQIGLDQRLVEFARVGDGVANGVASDLVEADPADGDALQRLLVLQFRQLLDGNFA